MTLTELLAAYPAVGIFYTAFVRFLFPVLAGAILYRAVKSLLRAPHTPETWGQLSLPGGGSVLLTHWENILGRGKSADVRLNFPSVSRQHAALCRGEDGAWTLYDLDSKGGVLLNGEKVEGSAPIRLGDKIELGGVPLLFLPQTAEERKALEEARRKVAEVAGNMTYMELSTHPGYMDRFVAACFLPHTDAGRFPTSTQE